VKNVFRCARCGCNGGIFDLYALYTNTPRKKVRDEIIRTFASYDKNYESSKQKQVKNATTPQIPIGIEASAAKICDRHEVYSSLLSLLSLSSDHLNNLINRGLSQQAIIDNRYKTTPIVGGKLIAKELLKMGHKLNGIPGFYMNANGQWTFISMQRGILIPVRNIQNKIQGLQVRRDNQEKRKYRWVSSANIEFGTHGCGAEGWVHLAGQVKKQVILIEGPLKADIVHFLTGQTVTAIPGVNSLKHLENILIELRELGMERIMTAFDMDFLRNPHVKNGYEELVTLLNRINIRFGTYLWHPDYNGLDDYVWECCLGRKIS
jgi:hypothetical protein